MININRDTILAIILTDLYDSHARNDLRASIDACDDLDHFAELNIIDMRDSDTIYAILDPFDYRADELAALLRDRDTYLYLHTESLEFLRNLDY